MDFLKSLFAKLVDPDKIGGWVRALVASGLTAIVATWAMKLPVIGQIITPDVIVWVSVAVGTFVTGILSNISKA